MRLDRIVAAVFGVGTLAVLGGLYVAVRRARSSGDGAGDDLSPSNVARAVEHAVTGGKVFHMEKAPSQSLLCRSFLFDWNDNGAFAITLTRGDTTPELQAALYAQGRTTAGPIVTNAPTIELTPHGHGGAFDASPVREVFANGLPKRIFTGNEPDTDVMDDGRLARDVANERIEALIAAGKAAGLVNGENFPGLHDRDHFEDPDWQTLPVLTGGSA